MYIRRYEKELRTKYFDKEDDGIHKVTGFTEEPSTWNDVNELKDSAKVFIKNEYNLVFEE